ncbi:MAG: glycoside hydrolase family 3 C-terminal domain-containing protein [Phaeodactylibacter sp.]|uniref:beta-glucosidase family protein n=1 Tax=Phaeodactylibacter sp. TaxID=1940289 RepID=UPI0032EAB144
MKKWVKIPLIGLGSLLLLVLLAGLGGWLYLRSGFLFFEKDYPEPTGLSTLTIDGYSFVDRNSNAQLDPYEDDRLPLDVRADDLLAQMTTEEKIHLLKGSGMASGLGMTEPGEGIPGAVGTIVPTPRLGLPTVYLSDGPAGLRINPTRKGEDRTYYCTAFPIGTMLASTWNTDLVQEVGNAMGNEALEYGIDVILGPGANIHRHPFCGRNFEYYAEDPVLTGKIGAAMVNGIESNGVGTSVKHFVANNQETDRHLNNAIVSERALREIYLKGFEIIVKEAQPWTLMSSYNQVNGTYVSESRYLLTDVLRGDWNFEGIVMSDWFGGQDAVAQIRAGNDLLEPGTNKQWKALRKAHEAGALPESVIDTSAKRILKLVLQSRKMQGYHYRNDPDLQAHARLARQSAAEGMVLLKNEGALPLEKEQDIALLGITSYDFIAGGTGSGDVNEAYTVALETGLRAAGFNINATARKWFDEHKAAHEAAFTKPEGFQAMTQPYDPPEMDYTDAQLQQVTAEADVGILTIGRNSGEGGDRVKKNDFLLSEQEQSLLNRACDAFQSSGKPLVVVLNIGGGIETASWKERPDAILLAWQGGQEGGHAAADILSGKVNPCGKLPMTFPLRLDDHASNANFPLEGGAINFMNLVLGEAPKPEAAQVRNKDFTRYEEGIYVGYRHFDKTGLDVSYPFGYGLSYTRFEYSNLEARMDNDTIHLALNVQNTGARPGREAVQVYAAKPETTVDRPVQELKAFAKTPALLPGAATTLHFKIPVSDLQYWDEESKSWALEAGLYLLKAGSSSRDIRLEEGITVTHSR